MMQAKHKLSIFVSLAYSLTVLISILIPFNSYTQMTNQDIATQRLVLQLAACYLNVGKENQIDVDSALSLAAQRSHVNPLIVIGESFEDILQDPANTWVNKKDINAAKKRAWSSKGSPRFLLLNLTGYFYVFQPGARKNDMNSAFLYLSTAKLGAESAGDIKSLCQSLCGLGKYYLERGDVSLAASTFTTAIKKADESGFKKEEEMAWTYWATYSPFNPNTIIERINHLKKANVLNETMGNIFNEINNLSNIGYLSFAAGKIDDAKQAFLKAVEMVKIKGFPYIHYSLDKLAFIALISGDHENKTGSLKIEYEIP